MTQSNTFKGLILLLFSVLTLNGLFAQTFWLETFANQATATTNWVNGGTNAGAETWTWTTDPLAGFVNAAVPAFNSPSVADGYFYFNSDANGENNAHDVTLTNVNKPADCSGRNNVHVRFQYQYIEENVALAKAYVGVSTDGMNFTYHEVLSNAQQGEILQGSLEVDIPEANNQPQVWLQFRWTGNWEYHWKIDDVELFEVAGPVPCDQNPMAIVCDNMDQYVTTQKLAQQNVAQNGAANAWWTTWSGATGTTEDGIITTEKANSGANSFKIVSTASNGGPQDVVLKLGNKAFGRYELKWKIYVPAGKNGYYNVQQTVPIGAGDWNLNVFFNNGGQGQITDGTNAVLANFTYPYDTWFECKHVFDLDNNIAAYYIDGKFVKKTGYARNLGGIDFYGTNAVSTFYVDDVEYVELPPVTYDVDICSGAIDLALYFGQAPNVPQTTGLYDNTNTTAQAGDPSVTCWAEDINNTAMDVVNNSMWYTFIGDGNTYHIETVPCNASNYINDGDTQMLILAGDNCSNLTPIACNDDLSQTGDPDYRAGLDLDTENGLNYYMLIDGYQLNGVVATGEFCIEITQIPSVTCADGVAGTVEVLKDFICDGDGTGAAMSLDPQSFVIPNIGPVYGLCWAITTAPVPAGEWPPSLDSYWGSFGTSASLYVPNLTNNGASLQQNAIWYFTPVVIAGAVDSIPSDPAFMHQLNIDNGCYFTGESIQLIMLGALDPLNATYDFLAPTAGNNDGAIDLTVTGGLFDVVNDPLAYTVSWTGPNGFTSNEEDLVNLSAGTYTAVITDLSGCTDPITVIVSLTTSVDDPKSVKAFTVNPNPTNGIATLNLALTEAVDVRYEVVDVLGRVLESGNAGTTDTLNQALDLSSYASGTYLLRVTLGNEMAQRRIVLQR